MLKVNILSMHRICNHGSFLQSYGLKKVLQGLRAEVNFIDIKFGKLYPKCVFNTKAEYSKSQTLKYFLGRLFIKYLTAKQNKLLKNIQNKYLGLSDELLFEREADATVIGSDEVFNCLQNCSWGLSLQLFGKVDSPKVIAYAASCGSTTYDALTQEMRTEIADAMSHFNAISVRDKNTFDFVQKLSGKHPVRHLDPVFVYSFKDELIPCSIKNKFLLVYSYGNRINDQNEIKMIKTFAKKHGLLIICAGVFQCWCRINLIVEPFELLGFFEKAEFVITDTFHGTVLSIKYNKKFVTLIRSSNSNKLFDLLGQFGLIDRIVENGNMERIIVNKIDYIQINQLIEEERIRTLDYLSANLLP